MVCLMTMMIECICSAPDPCKGRCEQHERDLHGYPCCECQREWRESHPAEAARIDRLLNGVFPSGTGKRL